MAISSTKGPIAVVTGRREGVVTVLIQRPRRRDKPFSPDMSEADVDWVLTLKPFSDMVDSKFPQVGVAAPATIFSAAHTARSPSSSCPRGQPKQAITQTPKYCVTCGFWANHSALAQVYGQLGRLDEARAAAATLLELNPTFGEKAREELRKFFHAADHIEHPIDGLRKAGLDIPDEPAGTN